MGIDGATEKRAKAFMEEYETLEKRTGNWESGLKRNENEERNLPARSMELHRSLC